MKRGFSVSGLCCRQVACVALLVSVTLAAVEGCSCKEFESCEADRACETAAGGASGAGDETGPSGATGGVAGSDGAAGEGHHGGAAGSGPVAGAPGLAGGAGAASIAGAASMAGAAATAGTAGTAGAAGAAGAPECEQDAQCDDGLACNGQEHCLDGQCEPGESACPNPDAEHCSVRCEEINGAAECVVEPLDQDEDDHGSADCEQNPGDDCDDTRATVHPGAEELCDGLDNDCNDQDELDEGLFGLWGETVLVTNSAAATPAIAWAPEAGVYAIAWQDYRHDTAEVPNTEIYFKVVDPSGAEVVGETRLSDWTGDSWQPDIAWNGSAFGLSWSDAQGTEAGSRILFRLLDPDGTFSSEELQVFQPASAAPSVTFAGTSWLVFWQTRTSDSQIRGARVSAAGGTVSGSVAVTAGEGYTWPQAATAGDQVGVTSIGPTDIPPGWLRYDAELIVQQDEVLNMFSSNANVVIAGSDSGWALASRSADRTTLAFIERALDGTPTCGPIHVPANRGPLAMATVGNAHFLVTQEMGSPGELWLRRIQSGCNAGAEPLQLDTASAMIFVTGIAASEIGVAAVWNRENQIYARFMGTNLCDEPGAVEP